MVGCSPARNTMLSTFRLSGAARRSRVQAMAAVRSGALLRAGCRSAATSMGGAATSSVCEQQLSQQQRQRPLLSHQQHRLGDMDYTTLAAAVAEVQSLLPARCEQAVQLEPALLGLRLRTAADTTHMYLSWRAGAGGLTCGGPPASRGAAAEAYGFGEQLQAALRGSVLTSVVLPAPWERVVRLGFAERLGASPSYCLFHEVQGRLSNLVLTGGEGEGARILAAGHQVGGRQSSLRQVQVGGSYALPPPGPGLDPDLPGSRAEWQEAVQRAAAAAEATAAAPDAKQRQRQQQRQPLDAIAVLVRAFRGVSPALARELCTGAGVREGAAVAALSDEQWAALWARWRAWLDRLASGSFAACTCPETGALSVLGSYNDHPAPSLLRLLHMRQAEARESEERATLRRQMQAAVVAAAQRARRKLASLREQGAQEGRAAATAKQADLLMSAVHMWRPGMESLQVEDWDVPGSFVTIPLEGRSAVDQAARLYKAAAKQRRAAAAVAPLVAEAEGAIAFLAEAALQLEQMDEGPADLPALREMRADLIEAGFLKPPRDAALEKRTASRARRGARRGGGGAEDGSAAMRRYVSPGGFAVVVGRNSRQNDTISMKMTQPTDLWCGSCLPSASTPASLPAAFMHARSERPARPSLPSLPARFHARGVPGAHVLLRVGAGQSASDADVAFAADLAAYFSKARGEAKVGPGSPSLSPSSACPRLLLPPFCLDGGLPDSAPAMTCRPEPLPAACHELHHRAGRRHSGAEPQDWRHPQAAGGAAGAGADQAGGGSAGPS